MKKLNVPSYLMRTKWFIVFLAVLALVIFGRTVNSPELTKTAVVLGAGLDYSEENAEFIVTTQSVLMASSSSEGAGLTSYDTFTATGRTIAEALDAISRKMGLTISLAHCNVLFVSTSVLKLDHMQLIYPLTGMYSLPENAILVTGEKSPREMLSTQIGTTKSASYFLQLALTNKEGTSGMIRTNVKDFLARSLSRSKATVIPYITAKEMPNQPITSDGEQEKNYEFDMSSTLVFNHDDSQILKDALAEALSLYLTKSTFGSLNYVGENGERVEFRLLNKSVDSKAKGRKISAEMELVVELLDVQFVETDKVLTGADPQIRKAADELAKEIEGLLTKLFEISKEWNIDFLGLQAKAYQSVGRTLEEDCLNTLSFEPKVTLQVKETA
ncbi:MAG: Ger(x)C family spore germination C-terminal domain-containing protein [Bacteroides sp.]|nr:Ger(x)C family spore germination C-terminal domain-containing protein [Bacillota bacterium]MCM1394115.1 Ger(x)C family spore germination C-terminal domain-containing protein [[Eubacterium] siraeum]MCM1455932.1 Ger(x)C family spore germination C-terminal domain-containing protein [Bacteroides sp.]